MKIQGFSVAAIVKYSYFITYLHQSDSLSMETAANLSSYLFVTLYKLYISKHLSERNGCSRSTKLYNVKKILYKANILISSIITIFFIKYNVLIFYLNSFNFLKKSAKILLYSSVLYHDVVKFILDDIF